MTSVYANVPFERKSIIPIDPRTKIFLTITISTIMCTGGTSGVMVFVRPVLMTIPIVFLLLQKKWKSAIRFSFTYSVLFAGELFLMPMLSGTWNFIFGAAIGIYTHMLPGFIMGYYLIESTTVSEFVAAMERMHISQKIVIPMSVVFRLFPTIGEEFAAIRDAMRLRDIASFRDPVKMIEYRVVPLLISVANIGEELSAAALTKGLGGSEKRTNICSIGFGLLDVLLFMAALCCWIGYFI